MQSIFRVSARAHLGVILMAKLSESHSNGEYTALRDVADVMSLSEGYLEEIAASLKAHHLVIGKTGPKGGYRLARNPKTISAEDILIALEGPVELVDCQTGTASCPVSHLCHSKHLWFFLQEHIRDALRQKTLADICAIRLSP